MSTLTVRTNEHPPETPEPAIRLTVPTQTQGVVPDRIRVRRRWAVVTRDRSGSDRAQVLIVRYAAGVPTISRATRAAAAVRPSPRAAGLEPPSAARPGRHDVAVATPHPPAPPPARYRGVSDDHRSLPGHLWHHRQRRRQHRHGRQRQ